MNIFQDNIEINLAYHSHTNLYINDNPTHTVDDEKKRKK